MEVPQANALHNQTPHPKTMVAVDRNNTSNLKDNSFTRIEETPPLERCNKWSISSCTHSPRAKTALPFDFSPSATHIICGRGRNCINHFGNKKFREFISMYVDLYMNANSKAEKSLVVIDALNRLREMNPEGGFVKYDAKTEIWYEIGDQLARNKVGHAFRDASTSRKRLSWPPKWEDNIEAKKRKQKTTDEGSECEEEECGFAAESQQSNFYPISLEEATNGHYESILFEEFLAQPIPEFHAKKVEENHEQKLKAPSINIYESSEE